MPILTFAEHLTGLSAFSVTETRDLELFYEDVNTLVSEVFDEDVEEYTVFVEGSTFYHWGVKFDDKFIADFAAKGWEVLSSLRTRNDPEDDIAREGITIIIRKVP